MNVTVLAFVAMGIVAVGFVFATLLREVKFEPAAWMQTGDSSLKPSSVNWLAGTALASVLFICFVLM